MNMQHCNTDVKRRETEGCNVITFPENASCSADRGEYIGAIQHWCQTRDLSDALSREEIGALDKFDRVDAQRKAFLLNQIHYYRRHPRADVAPGVAAIIHFLSDNDKGASTVSQATMAKLFNRSISSIADAHRRLREDGIIVTGRGRYPMTYPVIPRAVTQSYNHMTWLLAAVVDASEELFNLPVPPDDCQSSGQTRGLNSIIRPDPMIEKLNHPVETVSIIRPDPMQLHYKNSEEEKKEDILSKSQIAAMAGAIASAFIAASPVAANAAPQPQAAACYADQIPGGKVEVPVAGPIVKKRAPKKQLVPETYPNDFLEFWKIYPRREGKAAAAASWDRLTMDQKRTAYRSLKVQLPELGRRAIDPRGNFCPLPATWINQGRFDDEIEQSVQRGDPPKEGEWNGKFYLNSRVVPEVVYQNHIEGKKRLAEGKPAYEDWTF